MEASVRKSSDQKKRNTLGYSVGIIWQPKSCFGASEDDAGVGCAALVLPSAAGRGADLFRCSYVQERGEQPWDVECWNGRDCFSARQSAE